MTTLTETQKPSRRAVNPPLIAMFVLTLAIVVMLGFVAVTSITSIYSGSAAIESTLTDEYDATFEPGVGGTIRNGDSAVVEIDGEQLAVTLVGPKDFGDAEPQFTFTPILGK